MSKDHRKDNSQLPSASALSHIIDLESQRNIPTQKQNKHFHNMKEIEQLLSPFELDTTFLKSNEPNIVLFLGEIFVKKATEKILIDSKPYIENLNNIYDYLSEEDPLPAGSDNLIFVFGSPSLFRITKAIELYHQKHGNKLILSGHSPNYTIDHQFSEAERDYKLAIKSKIPATDILVENKSITFADNVRTSLNLLDSKKIAWKNIILVNSPYTQRRGWGFFQKYIKDHQHTYRVNSKTGEDYTKQNWFKNSHPTQVVLNEMVKLKIAHTLNTS